ncbi:MAG: acyl-CoA dehydrogenase family protein [Actinobacteria bacterium]|nr:acyl-CoA dehydrogenase family protein [Actinomycetota bacterium]
MKGLEVFLDGDYADVRAEVRERLRRPELAPAPADIDLDEYRERVMDQARFIAAEGGSGLGFPKEYGGEGDVGASVVGFEMLGHGDLSTVVKVGVQFGLCGGAIYQLGTEEHHDRYLADIVTLDLPGCFAMTESGHGSDVQSLETTATYDPDSEEFVIHTPTESARKDYIGNAATHGRIAAVFAQLYTGDDKHGVHCFVVPIRDGDGTPCPGVEIGDCGHKIGLNGVDNGRLSFDHVRVPRTALLSRFGDVAPDGTYTSPIEDETKRFFTMLGTLVQGRISVSGGAISATKNALTIAVRYGLSRRQFSPPDSHGEVLLLDYLAHQRRLLPKLATVYALSAAQQFLVRGLHDSAGNPDYPARERRKLETHAAGVKALSTWHASETIQTCREACGGVGYLSENRLGQLKADTDVFATFEGDNTVLLQLVAKELLTDYRDEFGELDTLGTIRFVADQAFDVVVERTAGRQLIQTLIDALPGRDEDASVRDRGWHLALFTFREEHIIDGLARRLRNGIENGEDPFDVFNRSQDQVLLAAKAHMDRLVLEQFVTTVDDIDDDEARELLDKLCELHALSVIERERAWFLEHGRITGARAKAVISAVNELCGELRPHARALVDAFRIPDEVLAAPIGVAPADTPSGS